MAIKSVCVFCASSHKVDRKYFAGAAAIGLRLASAKLRIVFGGGRNGLMGAVADAALLAGGEVLGILPGFMGEHEVGHQKLTEMRIVDSMEMRLAMMLAESEAFLVLPGGPGTLEELFFIISRRKLERTRGHIVIFNQDGFFDPAIAMLDRCIAEYFLEEKYREQWSVVHSIEEILPNLQPR
jgi:uncharacterized protein (TIGR00730 family)